MQEVENQNNSDHSDDGDSAIYFEEQRNLDFDMKHRPNRITYQELVERCSAEANIPNVRSSGLEDDLLNMVDPMKAENPF